MNTVLDTAHALAIEMVDLVGEVAFADEPDLEAAWTVFSRESTTYVRGWGSRQHLKHTIDRLLPAIRRSAWEMRMLDPDPLNVAARLVTTAVKALVAGVSPANRWVLGHRLAVKLENCTDLWIEDETIRPEDLVAAAPTASSSAKNQGGWTSPPSSRRSSPPRWWHWRGRLAAEASARLRFSSLIHCSCGGSNGTE